MYVPVVAVDTLEGLQARVNIQMFIQGEDRGKALLADGADEVLDAVSQAAMFYHLQGKRGFLD